MQELILLTARGTMQGPGGNTVELRSDATILDVGQEAVLFLARSQGQDAYHVVGNAAGVFIVRDKSVTIPAAARRYGEFGTQAELEKDRFFSLLRALRTSGGQ